MSLPFLFASVLLAVVAPSSASAARPLARFVSHHEAGQQPTCAQLADDGARLIVSNRGDNSVWVYDASSMKVERQYTNIGFGAWGLAVAPDDGTLVVGNWGGENLSLVDRATGKLLVKVPVGIKPSYVAVSPDRTRAYSAGNLTGDVTLVDLTKRSPLRTLEVGQKPMGVAISPDGRWLYVASCNSNKVSKVDLKHEVVLEHFGAPLATTTNLAITADGKDLLAAGSENRLLVIATENGDVRKVKVGTDPAAVTLSPDGATAFVANYGGDSVSLVDVTQLEAYAEVAVGRGPIWIETDGQRLFTCNDRAGSVTQLALDQGGLETRAGQ